MLVPLGALSRYAAPGLVLALLGFAVAGVCAQTHWPARGAGMTTPGPLQLSDDEFWSAPERTRSQVAAPFERDRRNALLYDAPTRVQIESRSSLPTQVVQVSDARQLHDKPYERFAVVVVTDLDNNLTLAARAVPPLDEETEAPEPIDRTAPVQESIGNDAYTIDLRERLDLPWEPGRFLARLILLDEITPPRPIELVSVRPPDPEVQRYLDEARARTRVPVLVPPPGVVPGEGADLPVMPDGIGMNLDAPRVCVPEAGIGCMLRGAFRLPVLRRHLIPPGERVPGTEEIRAQFDADPATRGAALPTAVVPITLVAVGDVSGGPSIWRLVLPVASLAEAADGRPIGTGSFALDLRELRGFVGTAQTWHLYAFSDESGMGPLTVGLARPPRTP